MKVLGKPRRNSDYRKKVIAKTAMRPSDAVVVIAEGFKLVMRTKAAEPASRVRMIVNTQPGKKVIAEGQGIRLGLHA